MLKNIKFLFVFILIFTFCLNPSSFAQNSSKTLVKTICLDAGHGGKDPGAIGKNSREADNTLKIILELGKQLKEEMPDLNIIYTRKTNVFVDLFERAEIANRNKADLFISVHCNAAANKNAYGTETYTMGLHKTDGNLNVAKRENSVILQEKDYESKYEGFDPSSPLAHIMLANFQSAYMANSIKFASYVQENFEKKNGRRNLGVKQAGFIVIWRTAMPSVLVETGFITNASDEAFISSANGQKEIASSIVDAVKKYKKEIEN